MQFHGNKVFYTLKEQDFHLQSDIIMDSHCCIKTIVVSIIVCKQYNVYEVLTSPLRNSPKTFLESKDTPITGIMALFYQISYPIITIYMTSPTVG